MIAATLIARVQRAALSALAFALLWAAPTQAQISLPFKVPQLPQIPQSLGAAKQQAGELALRTVLNNELPLRLDAANAYPTVATLPGKAPFNPSPLHLVSPADLDRPLPPGDYTLQALAFCTEYSVHVPGAGTAYELGPLEGKAAEAIWTLLWRGTILLGLPKERLQGTSWAIQSGLTYTQLPKIYQTVVDTVIPEYKGQISGNFLQRLQDTYKSASQGTNLPPLEKLLGDMGQSGQLALSAMRQQQILLRQDTSEQLREQTLFRGQESGVYTPVKAEQGPWTERIPHLAYLRYKIVGGNGASNNVIEIRILPSTATAAEFHDTGRFTRVAYGRTPIALPGAPQPSVTGLLGGSTGVPVGKGAQILIPVPVVPPPPPPPDPNNPCGLSPEQLTAVNTKAQTKMTVTIPQTNTTADLPVCECAAKNWNLCPPKRMPTGPQFSGTYVDVYANYCLGAKQNGIAFLPKLPANSSCPSTQQMHIQQFVSTTCLMGKGNCGGASYPSSCGVARKFDTWYLDQCPGQSYLGPDVNGALRVISDAPSVDLQYPGGQPVKKTFYDFVTCDQEGGEKFLEAFTWTRTSFGTPQFCVDPSKQPPAIESIGGQYQVQDLGDLGGQPFHGLNNVVCEGIKTMPDPSNTSVWMTDRMISLQVIEQVTGGC